MTKQDNVPYNYCYYSSMEQHYDYLAILDVDEVHEKNPDTSYFG